jgi:hypothetical protein
MRSSSLIQEELRRQEKKKRLKELKRKNKQKSGKKGVGDDDLDEDDVFDEDFYFFDHTEDQQQLDNTTGTMSKKKIAEEEEKAQKKNKLLTSSRWAPMFLPNMEGWDFMDKFTISKPTTLALSREQISYDHLDKYMKVTYKLNIEEQREAMKEVKRPLPPLLNKILKLQARDGKFDDLKRMFYLLHMPENTPFVRGKHYSDWEKATSFALAAMRQEIEYFDEIFEYHEKASKWISSGELISETRELLIKYQGTCKPPNWFEELENQTVESTNDMLSRLDDEESEENQLNSFFSNLTAVTPSKIKPEETNTIDEGNGQVLGVTDFQTDPEATVGLGATMNTAISSIAGEGSQFDYSTLATEDLASISDSSQQQHEDLLKQQIEKAMEEAIAAQNDSRPGSPNKLDHNAATELLRKKVKQLAGEYNYEQLYAQRALLDNLEKTIIALVLEIEELVRQISYCLDRCVDAYNAAELSNIRYRTFDELTARLGDGFEASLAYEDWRKEGVPGIRPRMIEFFNLIHQLALERLKMLELLSPGGRDWKVNNDMERNRGKWLLIWNGHNVVFKVLHW